MPTDIETLETRITKLEAWLKYCSTENLEIGLIQSDLRKAKEELAELQGNRSFERDTFDIREHNFNTAENEGK
jgi:hypothetical protein